MKNTIRICFIAFFISIGVQSQNNCSKYYPMEKGIIFNYKVYDKKGKLEGTTKHEVAEITSENGQTHSKLNISYTDAKGKHNFDSNYGMTCTGTGIKIDFMSLMPNQMISQYEDMDVEMDITGTDIELPNDLSVGRELADANVNVTMNMSGIKMKISVYTVNRKVIANEELTTPAGTFSCLVLNETVQSKSMGANVNITSITWLAEGIGMIKNETYKKNGALMGKTELNAYSN